MENEEQNFCVSIRTTARKILVNNRVFRIRLNSNVLDFLNGNGHGIFMEKDVVIEFAESISFMPAIELSGEKIVRRRS